MFSNTINVVEATDI